MVDEEHRCEHGEVVPVEVHGNKVPRVLNNLITSNLLSANATFTAEIVFSY